MDRALTVTGILLATVGTVINIISLIFVSRTTCQAATFAKKVLYIIIVQHCIDIVACIAYLLSSVGLDEQFPSIFTCRILRTRALFWTAINYRAYINVYGSLWQHVRIIYPFWSTVLNRTEGCLGLFLLATAANILQTLAFTRLSDLSADQSACIPCTPCQTGENAGIYSFLVLYSTIYRFAFPSMAMFASFGYLMQVLSDCDGKVYKKMYKETRKNLFIDTVLFVICLSTHEALFTLNVFASNMEYGLRTAPYEVASLLALGYPVLSPCFSMCLRTTNYTPVLEAVLRPMDYQKLSKLAIMWSKYERQKRKS
ncbi:hypothetical protein CSKR_201644 [Clonorchis sinensis]|uniref:Uncharacterized protein n=1 Tax=Clonorchis sinensis TaxID=79923 RepID=A0A8T1MT60_CLOSI|nr:hypothetical protein CSKR_201644 [Clonorchis sinensis]